MPPTVAVIIPLYKTESTILATLESLQLQSEPVDDLIIVNDEAEGKSLQIVEEFLKKTGRFRSKIINHTSSIGLARSYNEAISRTNCDLVIFLHADVILQNDALKYLIAPFKEPMSERIVATTHYVIHPYEIWNKYNFWQKCFFARLVGRRCSGIDGKFDCFRREAILRVGKFSEKLFRSAGEDGDMIARICKIGDIVQTDATIMHLHKLDNTFNLTSLIFKQLQYSEAQGALFRLGRINSLLGVVKAFFREILIVSLVVPYIQILALLLIISYSYFYTAPVYIKEYKNPRVLILPIINTMLLFISMFGSARGFIYGKQRY